MAFDLIYSPAADEQFSALPVHLQSAVLDNLERLADDPVSSSAPPSSPLWPVRQLFVFEVDDGVDCYLFSVVWRYHEDENSLRILAIAQARIPRNEDGTAG